MVTRRMEQALERYGAELGTAPEMERVKRRVGTVELQAQRQAFVKHSEASNGFWPELSLVTVVLRRQAKGRIYGWEDVGKKQARIKKLRDRGILLNSLTPGAPGNVLITGETVIAIGSSRREAELHQTGGTSTFQFDEGAKARFERNVSRTKKGRREPEKLAPGHRYRWGQKRRRKKKQGLGAALYGGAAYYARGYWWHPMTGESPWNPLFFILRNYLRKIDGTARRVPKREIVSEPPPERLERHAAEIERGLEALGRRLGL